MPVLMQRGTAWHGTAWHCTTPAWQAPAGSVGREVPTELCFSSQLKEKERNKEGNKTLVQSNAELCQVEVRMLSISSPPSSGAGPVSYPPMSPMLQGEAMDPPLWDREGARSSKPALRQCLSPRVQDGMAKGHVTAAGRIQPDLSFQQSTSRYPVSLPLRLGTPPPPPRPRSSAAVPSCS